MVNTTGIKLADLRHVIALALEPIGLFSTAAEQLLLGTTAIESQCGHYLQQIGGPALGVYQIEPKTHLDIWDNYLIYNNHLAGQINALMPTPLSTPDDVLLMTDLRYATIMARLVYYRQAEPLPDSSDIVAQAQYWKTYYNTTLGKGTVADYISTAKSFGIC